jgi:hypothetical protein
VSFLRKEVTNTDIQGKTQAHVCTTSAVSGSFRERENATLFSLSSLSGSKQPETKMLVLLGSVCT